MYNEHPIAKLADLNPPCSMQLELLNLFRNGELHRLVRVAQQTEITFDVVIIASLSRGTCPLALCSLLLNNWGDLDSTVLGSQ